MNNAASNPTDGGMDFNITDHGGFHSLPHGIPPLLSPSQRVDLTNRAFRGAVLSNLHIMDYLNATRESSFTGKGYKLGWFEDTSETQMQEIRDLTGPSVKLPPSRSGT
ncbi:hypothetical protein D9756_006367 [Leucocoprinus leucothites]|uniref:Uncharacterized protein n=1 Tax=Leucocoprinus leucothites TaxID=201217 RepID=A0A8H5G2M0_9AGAR|nr:hypothetical protein D9756_006367 [Leucoagaricus leucothites]